MSQPTLTAEAIHDAFMELGAQALAEGKVIDLAVYGADRFGCGRRSSRYPEPA
jgi:hypothetical protein